jgi:predicted DNA-binding transcriptional regulator YafY
VRADRLVAELLILQSRGRVTAAEVAEELEISERTARRDLEALAMAGIPVYSQAGRGGGWSLVGGARTDLSGLTAAEARTLFLVAGPSAAATPQVKAALRKLVRALPEPFRADAEAAASAIVLDPSSWDRGDVPTPAFLEELQRAVVEGIQVRLSYVDRERRETERVVHPLGLVAKASVWYLVAGTEAGLRTFRVSRVRGVARTDDPVDRPDGFDLAATWEQIRESLEIGRTPLLVTLLVEERAVTWVRGTFGRRATIGEPRNDARTEATLRSWSADAAASELAAFAEHVEVVDPPEVREALRRIGASLVATYAGGRG